MQVAAVLQNLSFAPPRQTFWEEWFAGRQRFLTPYERGSRYFSQNNANGTVHIAGNHPAYNMFLNAGHENACFNSYCCPCLIPHDNTAADQT